MSKQELCPNPYETRADLMAEGEDDVEEERQSAIDEATEELEGLIAELVELHDKINEAAEVYAKVVDKKSGQRVLAAAQDLGIMSDLNP